MPEANFPTKLFVHEQAKKVYSKPINNFLSTLTKRRVYTKYFVANICLNEKTFDVFFRVKSYLITHVINNQAKRKNKSSFAQKAEKSSAIVFNPLSEHDVNGFFENLRLLKRSIHINSFYKISIK